MSRRSLDIIHIYAGTSGSAGTYINEIFTALKGKYTQEIFVSYYYPFSYGKNVFYKYSDLSSPYSYLKRNQLFRYGLRYVELLFALIHILFYLSKRKVKLVNYNLTSDLRIEYWFLSFLKLFKIKIAITCHDVIPFGLDDSNKTNKIKVKKRFFDFADFLIVHNENSIEELRNILNIRENKVFKFSFPIMNLSNFPANGISAVPDIFISNDPSTFRVGMVGHFRKEKGLDIMLRAWNLFCNSTKKAELFLVGNFTKGIDTSSISVSKNIHIYDQFVDDSMYISVIKNCDLIVLPYKRGTNSGIPSSVISLGTLLITSDIEMFRNNSLINDSYLFRSDNEIDLCAKIEWLYSLSNVEREQLITRNFELLNKYRIEFEKSIQCCFSVLCKKQ